MTSRGAVASKEGKEGDVHHRREEAVVYLAFLGGAVFLLLSGCGVVLLVLAL